MLVLDGEFRQPEICMITGEALQSDAAVLDFELKHIPSKKLPLAIPLLLLSVLGSKGFIGSSDFGGGLEHKIPLRIRYSNTLKQKAIKSRWMAAIVGLILVGLLIKIPTLKTEYAWLHFTLFTVFFLWLLFLVR